MPEEKREQPARRVRPAERRKRLPVRKTRTGFLRTVRLESGGAGAAQGAAVQKERGRPAAQGYQHQGIGNQPGNLIFGHMPQPLCLETAAGGTFLGFAPGAR